MKDFAINSEGDDIVAYNQLLFKSFPLALFDPEYLSSKKLLSKTDIAQHHGRAAVQYFTYNNIDLVLRHYYRGGLPAKFIKDKFFQLGLPNSRVMRELDMLQAMKEQGLPVPEPAAAHIRKHGLSYQADIVTVLIPNAKTLSSTLLDKALAEAMWQKIGSVVKQFHDFDCNHADLNAHNIMLNHDGEIFLIDFDKSRFDSSSSAWKKDNLERLKRSLEKLAKENTEFNYNKKDFSALVYGYGQ